MDRWNDEQITYLKENYGTIPNKDIADYIGKTSDAVAYKGGRLGLSAIKNNWSDEDVEVLMSNIDSMSYIEIAELLGRSVKSVANKICNIRASNLALSELFVFEDGVKMRASASGTYRVNLEAMEVGQSFTYPQSDKTIVNIQRSRIKDKLFRSQSIDADTRRIWRVF